MIDNLYPTLRAALDIRPIEHEGQPCVLLRDPLQLSGSLLVVPQPLGLVLALCDGTRKDATALSAAVIMRYGVRIAPAIITDLLEALDAARLLENRAYAQALAQATAAYHAAPARPLLGGDHSYPAEAEAARARLDEYLAEAADVVPAAAGRGLLSPHIDYQRGSAVYARLWKRAAAVVQAAEVVIILGTDHYGDGRLFTLTRQHYATPFGVLPTARDIVDQLAEALGPEALAGELQHRGEHSVELAAIWLHHLRAGQACPVVPVLCGSLPPTALETHPAITAFVDTLTTATRGRRALIVAAGDLAHVGPAFSTPPVDAAGREALHAADAELIERMCAGDAAGFLSAIRRVADCNHVCGLPPIYLTLRLLGETRGECLAYAQCPADETNTSVVSIGGLLFE